MHFGFVIPDNSKISQDIFIPGECSMSAVTGHKVVVELTSYGSRNPRSGYRSPEGKVVEILGHVNDPGVDVLSIVRGFELPVEFGEAILNQAARVAKPVSEADCNGRLDLRNAEMIKLSVKGDADRIIQILRILPVDGHHPHVP